MLVAIAVDALVIEPEWLEVTTVQIESSKVTVPVASRVDCGPANGFG